MSTIKTDLQQSWLVPMLQKNINLFGLMCCLPRPKSTWYATNRTIDKMRKAVHRDDCVNCALCVGFFFGFLFQTMLCITRLTFKRLFFLCDTLSDQKKVQYKT